MAKPNLEVYIGADIDGFNKGLKEVEKKSAQFGKNLDQNTKQTDNFGSAMNKVGGVIAGAFALDAIIGFGKAVIDITSQFQKFEAVLTNTLGSQSEAQKSLAQIKDLAASTPFSVAELTESFIKLANRGVKPSMEQMKAMGDLAATLGKPFEQVVEAIMDVNNPERWKEIGIQSETAGNKVKLSFRGVTQEVDRTVEGVTNGITVLGQMNGVMGSMDAISKTLGGQISNLGDSWDNFLNTVGSNTSGILSKSISVLNDTIGLLTVLLTDSEKLAKDFFTTYGVGQEKAIAMAMEEYKTRKANGEAIEDELKFFQDYIEGLKQQQQELQSYRDAAVSTFEKEKAAIEAKNKAQQEANKALREANKLLKEKYDIQSAEIGLSSNDRLSSLAGSEFSDRDINASANGTSTPFLDFGSAMEGADAYYNKIAEGELKVATAMQNTQVAMQENIDVAMLLNQEFESMFNRMFDDLAAGEFTWKKFGQSVLATIGKIITKLFAQAIAQTITTESSK